MNPSTALARVVVDELVRCGVTEVVLAPGSRSAPLAFALHAADAERRLRLHVRVDERTAGFLTLGLGRAGGAPAAVVTTSVTAVGNLLPAVMEASHAGVALLVVSADRPAELRDTGANQTTDQVGLFGGFVRSFTDLPAPAAEDQGAFWRQAVSRSVLSATGSRTGRAGPAHLNVQFRDPLVPDLADGARSAVHEGRPDGRPWTAASATGRGAATVLEHGPRTVVVAGDDAGPPARALAEAGGWPLLAEPTSGARTGTHALRCYRLLLAGPLADEVERVVVFGHPTLSRPVTGLLGRRDVEVVVVAPGSGMWPDAGHTAHRVLQAVEVSRDHARGRGAHPHRDWLHRWQQADRAAARAVDALIAAEPRLTPYSVAAAVHDALPPDGLLVVGSSNPIRDLDLMATPHPVGERRKTLANRGLSGIDGTVSTAVGAALARPRTSRAFAYIGDLTFLHDANGLVIGPDEPRPDLTVVVANDDGGSVFGLLEQGAPQHAPAFERMFGTPHRVDLAPLCAATGTPHTCVDDLPTLQQALRRPVTGIEVLEVPLDRSGRRDLDQRLRDAVLGPRPRRST